MSNEPLFCTQCGAEDWSCGHDDDGMGPWCEVKAVEMTDVTVRGANKYDHDLAWFCSGCDAQQPDDWNNKPLGTPQCVSCGKRAGAYQECPACIKQRR